MKQPVSIMIFENIDSVASVSYQISVHATVIIIQHFARIYDFVVIHAALRRSTVCQLWLCCAPLKGYGFLLEFSDLSILLNI